MNTDELEKTADSPERSDSNCSELLADCGCANWASSRRELDNEHHHRCKHWVKSSPLDPRYAKFGELMWQRLLAILPEYLGEEDSEEVMELAAKSGLCVWTRYDKDTHGHVEDVEPGEMIWHWGASDFQANA